MVQRPGRSALTIAATYALIAALWIVLSDRAVSLISDELHTLAYIGTAKGLVFVAVTSCALYALLRIHLARLQEMSERTARLERLERLGEVAASITHDFNNVLMVVRTFLPTLERSVSDPAARKAADHIGRAIARGEALTREILTFTTPQMPSVSSVHLSPFLEAFCEEFRSMSPSLEVQTRLPDPSLAIRADAGQLHRLLMNLAVNARDAMGKSGTLTISARETADARLTGAHRMVEIGVTDTGPGISPEVLARMFEPQFTTKRTGTGLGLAIVRRIVSDHGGRICVNTRIGSGTTVLVALPQDVPHAPAA